MRFHNSLNNKFGHIQQKQKQKQSDTNVNVKKPPVSATLRAFLQNQSMRLQHLIQKKKLCEKRLDNLATQHLSYRESLRNKIEQAQEKHMKNRANFLEKRVKTQKFKLDELQRKRKQFTQKTKQKKKSNQTEFKRHKSATIQFWNTKFQTTKKSYDNQVAVPPLYEQSISRKKSIQRRNQMYSQQEKDRLLAKHAKVQERIEAIVAKKQEMLEKYNEKFEHGYFRNLEILDTREKKFINDICLHQDNSQALLKTNHKKWLKKLQTKHLVQMDTLKKTKQNFTQRNVKRTQSMKDCRCHKRGPSSPNAQLTKSITLNQQQANKFSSTKRQQSRWNTPTSVTETRKNFMMQSQTNLSSVKNNKQIIKQRQEIRDQRKLMKEKEISDAVRTREDIKNQSNLLVRQARILA